MGAEFFSYHLSLNIQLGWSGLWQALTVRWWLMRPFTLYSLFRINTLYSISCQVPVSDNHSLHPIAHSSWQAQKTTTFSVGAQECCFFFTVYFCSLIRRHILLLFFSFWKQGNQEMGHAVPYLIPCFPWLPFLNTGNHPRKPWQQAQAARLHLYFNLAIN